MIVKEKMKDIIIKNSDRFKSVFVTVNMLLPLKATMTGKNALLAMVLKKSKTEGSILFIDASKECIKVTNNNKLSEKNINNIFPLFC